jgi:hypothetical protein
MPVKDRITEPYDWLLTGGCLVLRQSIFTQASLSSGCIPVELAGFQTAWAHIVSGRLQVDHRASLRNRKEMKPCLGCRSLKGNFSE